MPSLFPKMYKVELRPSGNIRERHSRQPRGQSLLRTTPKLARLIEKASETSGRGLARFARSSEARPE